MVIGGTSVVGYLITLEGALVKVVILRIDACIVVGTVMVEVCATKLQLRTTRNMGALPNLRIATTTQSKHDQMLAVSINITDQSRISVFILFLFV